jgi:hypothetical protein
LNVLVPSSGDVPILIDGMNLTDGLNDSIPVEKVPKLLLKILEILGYLKVTIKRKSISL